MSIYTDVLPRQQMLALDRLAPAASELDFYLAGGTALALQLGHRRSLDFDWFRAESFDPMLLINQLRDRIGGLTIDETARDTIHGRLDGVAVTFLRYDYPMLEELVSWEEKSLSLAHPDDIGAMKLAAIVNRGARKDFVDLDALFQADRALGDLLELFQRKYGFENRAQILHALRFFDDAESEPMPEMLQPRSWEQIRANIERAVEDYVG